VQTAAELQELIIGSEVPSTLTSLLTEKVASCFGDRLLAVRSSAQAEDGKVSFAGQYSSELNVPPTEVVQAYRRVLAGKYCSRAIGYRIRHGLSDSETAMAVLVLPMFAPTLSGVVYSRDPAAPEEDIISVYVVEGLGQALVDGSQSPVCYHLSRTGDDAPAQTEGKNGLELSAEQLRRLKEWGLRLENYFGCPQDVEWLLADGELLVVQSRPLPLGAGANNVEATDRDPGNDAAILAEGLHCAAPGFAGGHVFNAPSGQTFNKIPQGAVVVTPTLRPALSQFLDRIAGVISISGSRASHFASVARERAIPVVVGEGLALADGQPVTVDGYHGRVLEGLALQPTRQRKIVDDFPREKFAALHSAICHLNLTDPESTEFRVDNCQSLHDFIRYCHEQGVREMFGLVGRKGRGMAQARQLETNLPLAMYLLDLDSKLGSTKKKLALEDIASIPMRSCWEGLCDNRISWEGGPHHLDWEKFDQMSGGIFSLDSRMLASYAVTSTDYLHLNIRFGYHYSIVDALCGEKDGANYINFRFKGGGAAHEQQQFRLQFIETVLGVFGFDVKIHGELLDASLARGSLQQTSLGLIRLGRLLAYTRMMDMRLRSAIDAAAEANQFIRWAS
jgi:pyruvate,water dikinase